MHVMRGLRQAAGLLVGSGVVALAAAGVWTAVQGGGFRVKAAIALMVVAALISVTGGTLLSRDMTNDARAFLGSGPDREQPSSGEHLTAVGVFLFVSVPLFLVGGALFGRG